MVAGVHVAAMKAVAARLDELGGNLGALVQVPLVVLGVGRQGGQGRIPCMVLAERAFKQQDTGFQGHGRPLGHLIGALGGREVRDGEIQVLDHLVHNELAAVAGTVEGFQILGTHGLVVPRDVAEAFDLGEIEVSAEEAGQGLVADAHLCIRAVVQVFQEGVDVPEGGPAPAAAAGGNRALAHPLVGHVVLGVVVVVGEVQVRGREQLIEADGIGLQLTLALEERVGGKPVPGHGVQQVVTAGKSESGKQKQNGVKYLFHRGIH